ncbi:MAG: tRNA adenosine(34) deaminase TadA [Gammaproteobacteria bacterium]|nr:tRNA adenosine(34) deaminase TadA [Gammaproteobacteria bacterium]
MSADLDQKWMQYALELASRAEQQGEVPVGAVIVANDQVLGEGWNQSISLNDPTAHAEVIALRSAAQQIQNYRLPAESTLYVSLEPCPMCAGAMVHARIGRLVYGASDPRTGAAGSVFQIASNEKLNHRMEVQSGVLEAECASLLRDFFRVRRNSSSPSN